MNLRIDQEFKDCIPPLSPDELQGLEDDIVSAGIIRVPLDVWGDTIVDGHNRYEIATRLNIPFTVNQIEFESKTHAKIWIRLNQLHRRNLTDGWKGILIFQNKDDLNIIGKGAMSAGGKNKGLSLNDKPLEDKTPHDTRQILADELGWSTGKTAQFEFVMNNAPEELEKVKDGNETVGGAYKTAKKRQNKDRAKLALPQEPLPQSNIIALCDDMLTLVPSIGAFDLIIADPPYNVTAWEWDKIPEFLEQTRQWLTICKGALADNYHLFWFCSPSYAADIEMIFRELGLSIKSRLVWHRRNMSKGSDAKEKFIDTWEMIFHSGNGPLNFPIEWDSTRFDVQTFAVPQTNFTDEKLHPTQKPLELIKILVNYGSFPGGRVLDPFAGSGTTGAACLGIRDCVLIEKDEEYVNVIKQRLQQDNNKRELPSRQYGIYLPKLP